MVAGLISIPVNSVGLSVIANVAVGALHDIHLGVINGLHLSADILTDAILCLVAVVVLAIVHTGVLVLGDRHRGLGHGLDHTLDHTAAGCHLVIAVSGDDIGARLRVVIDDLGDHGGGGCWERDDISLGLGVVIDNLGDHGGRGGGCEFIIVSLDVIVTDEVDLLGVVKVPGQVSRGGVEARGWGTGLK